MDTTQRETDRFIVRTDEGQEITVIQFTEYERVTVFRDTGDSAKSAESGEVKGLSTLRTADGRPVNSKGSGVYEILGGMTTLRATKVE